MLPKAHLTSPEVFFSPGDLPNPGSVPCLHREGEPPEAVQTIFVYCSESLDHDAEDGSGLTSAAAFPLSG